MADRNPDQSVSSNGDMEYGRVEIRHDDPLYKEMNLRPSAATIAEIEKMERASYVALAKCDFPLGGRFKFHDEPGEHDPCYVVMPGGAMLPLNHHAGDGVDVARAFFIITACNAALAAPLKPETARGDFDLDPRSIVVRAARKCGHRESTIDYIEEGVHTYDEATRIKVSAAILAVKYALEAVRSQPQTARGDVERAAVELREEAEEQAKIGNYYNAYQALRRSLASVPSGIEELREFYVATEDLLVLDACDDEPAGFLIDWSDNYDDLEEKDREKWDRFLDARDALRASLLAQSPAPDGVIGKEGEL